MANDFFMDTIYEDIVKGEKEYKEKKSKELTELYKGKHLVYARYRNQKDYKYYGIVKLVSYNIVAARNDIIHSIGIDYINKKGEQKTARLRFDGWNDLQFFDSEADAKLFIEIIK